MWQCPNCETINNSEPACIICGQAKPAERVAPRENLVISSDKSRKSAYSTYYPPVERPPMKEENNTDKVGVIAAALAIAVPILLFVFGIISSM